MQISPRLLDLAKQPPRRLILQLGDEDQRAVRLMWQLTRTHWRAALLAFSGAALAAFFEGTTLGIFALALQALTAAEGSLGIADGFGPIAPLADSAYVSLGRNGLFVLLIGLAVVSQLLRSATEFGGDVAAAYLQAETEGDLRRGIFRQFMTMSYAQVRQYKVGDLASHNEHVPQLGVTFERLNRIISQLLLLAAYVLVLFWLSWPMTLAAVIALILLSSSLRRLNLRVRRIAHKYKEANVTLSARTVEFLHGLRLIRSFARDDYAIERIGTAIDQSVVARRRSLIWLAAISPVIDSVAVIGVALFLLSAFLLLGSQAQQALPRLATFLFVLYRLTPRVSVINKNWGLISSTWPFIERIADVLRTDDKEYLPNGQRPFTKLQEAIEFRNVSLHYNTTDRPAVHGLSFTIPRGQMVALVGESGAGKSTSIDLLLRLFDPTAGQILVDGVNLREFEVGSWREQIGVVSQDTFILNASIRDNLAFGRLDASDAEIEAAARAAHAHEFIMALSNGYQTVVGDQGYSLSGGQRQRLAIARAILRSPQILILDEATSELDSSSERIIQQALDQLRNQRTVLAVAHRLSTIARADQILVLERGQLIEQGTHAELLALNGRYAQLWQIQSGTEQKVAA
jgi:subfamily B ATP-binding cassette protein MsbA